MVPSPSGTKKAHDLLGNQGRVQRSFPKILFMIPLSLLLEKRFIGSFKRNAPGNFGECGLKSSMGHPKGMTLKTTAENQKLQIWGRQKAVQILQNSVLPVCAWHTSHASRKTKSTHTDHRRKKASQLLSLRDLPFCLLVAKTTRPPAPRKSFFSDSWRQLIDSYPPRG